MLPSTATLLCALGNEEAVHDATFWRDVQGFDFSCASEMERESCERSAPLVRVVPPSSIISNSATLRYDSRCRCSWCCSNVEELAGAL